MNWPAVLETQSLLDDDDLDIAETLLALSAADDPSRDWRHYANHMATLSDGLSGPASAERLAARIAGEMGYHGDRDTYDDMRNADIVEVIDRRRGLPVALGLLYLHAAHQVGWSLTGLNFPGHFLLLMQGDDGDCVIDPFNQGAVLQEADLKGLLRAMLGPEAHLSPEHMAPVPVRQVIVRLQNNIKVRALQAGSVDRARDILHRMTLFAPSESSVWLEWASLESKLGNVRKAVELLEEGGDYALDEATLVVMADARQRLRRRIH